MKPRRRVARCVLCDSSQDVEHHHIGGRNHLAWVTVPLCRPHHNQCHGLIESSAIDLEYTSDPAERLIRASKAINIFLCMALEALDQARLSQSNN
jgi:hypothetical protein